MVTKNLIKKVLIGFGELKIGAILKSMEKC